MKVHFLTICPEHPTVRALLAACSARNIAATASAHLIFAELLFPWAHNVPDASDTDREQYWEWIKRAAREWGMTLMIPHILGKSEQYRRLVGAGITVPDTRRVNDLREAIAAASQIGYPVVIKPDHKAGGKGVIRVENEEELARVWSSQSVVQGFVESSSVRRRVTVIDDEVVGSLRCVHDPRNFAQYKRYPEQPSDLGKAEKEMAVSACNVLQLPYGGVDLLISPTGPVLIEINHAGLAFDKDLPSLYPIIKLIEKKLLGRQPAETLSDDDGH